MIDENFINEHITKGGDRRIEILKGLETNKYFVNPKVQKKFFNRGSCTSSCLNIETIEHLKSLKYDEVELFRSVRTRLKKLLNYKDQDKFDVFVAPSGSDLTYFPLLFSQILYPKKEICSIVACPEELGSGTIKAASGKYFMDKTQLEDSVAPDSRIGDFQVETITIPARSKNGEIIDHRQLIMKNIHNIKRASRIVFLVVGSKSGIENDINVIDDVASKDVLWVVDLCQFRNRKKYVNDLLRKNCMVMITGSKFYQSPPFCGALLVPKSLSARILERPIPDLSAFENLFSRDNIPERFDSLRRAFKHKPNYGLHLRWECALYEMSKFDKMSVELSAGAMAQWNRFVMKLIEKSPYLEPMPNQDETNNTIISFRAKLNNKYLNITQMSKLFESVVRPKYNKEPFEKTFIGQPVLYGEKSFLRIAIGAYDLRKLIESKMDFSKDQRLVEIIEEKVEKVVNQSPADVLS